MELKGNIRSNVNENLTMTKQIFHPSYIPNYDEFFTLTRTTFENGKFVISNATNNAIINTNHGFCYFDDLTALPENMNVFSHKFNIIINPLPIEEERYYFKLKLTTIDGLDYENTIRIQSGGHHWVEYQGGGYAIGVNEENRQRKHLYIFKDIGVKRFEITKISSRYDNVYSTDYEIKFDMIFDYRQKEIHTPSLFGPNNLSYLYAFDMEGSVRGSHYSSYYKYDISYSYNPEFINETSTGLLRCRNGFIDVNCLHSQLTFVMEISRGYVERFPQNTHALIMFDMTFNYYDGTSKYIQLYMDILPHNESEVYRLILRDENGNETPYDITTLRFNAEENNADILLQVTREMISDAGINMDKIKGISFFTHTDTTNIHYKMRIVDFTGDYTYAPNFHIISDENDNGRYSWKLYRGEHNWGNDQFIYKHSRIGNDNNKYYTHLPPGLYTFGFDTRPTATTTIKTQSALNYNISTVKVFNDETPIGQAITLKVTSTGIVTEYIPVVEPDLPSPPVGEVDNFKIELTVPSLKSVIIKIYNDLTGWKNTDNLVETIPVNFPHAIATQSLTLRLAEGTYIVGVETIDGDSAIMSWTIFDISQGDTNIQRKTITEEVNKNIGALCPIHYIGIKEDFSLYNGLKYNKFDNRGTLRTDELTLNSTAKFDNSGSMIIDSNVELLGENSVLELQASSLSSVGGSINVKTNGLFDTSCSQEPTAGIIVRSGGDINTNDGNNNQNNKDAVNVNISGNSGIYFLAGPENAVTNIPGGLIINNKSHKGDLGYIAPDANVNIGSLTITNNRE